MLSQLDVDEEMIQNFITRVGALGVVAILAAAVVVGGLGGGLVEHFRLTGQQESQQGDQSGSQDESRNGSQKGQTSDQGQSDQKSNSSSESRQGSQD